MQLEKLPVQLPISANRGFVGNILKQQLVFTTWRYK